MKYKDMDNEQKTAFRQMLLNILDIHAQEELQFMQQIYRFLIVGNAIGMVTLATFMSNQSAAINSNSDLLTPFLAFFIGVILAAIVLYLLTGGANLSKIGMTKQIHKFFLNELDIDDFQPSGLNNKAIVLVGFLNISSFMLFCWGTYQCIVVLQSNIPI